MEEVSNPINFKSRSKIFERCLPSCSSSDNFYQGLKISPDGSCIISAAETTNKSIVYGLDPEFLSHNRYFTETSTEEETDLKSGVEIAISSPILKELSSVQHGANIYDFQWYPKMNLSFPETSCFISTSRDHPVHLYDATTGSLRCSYRAYDHLDELSAAISLSFNLYGEKIYCGYNNMIRVFDVSRPGRVCTPYPTRSSKRDLFGQRGIISVLSFNPDYSGMFAAGSYNKSVSIYDERSMESLLDIRSLDAGVSCLRWSPCGHMLWIGCRRTDRILCWDIRNSRCEIGRVDRPLETNQKLTFDLDPWGDYVITGTQDGRILSYSTKTFDEIKPDLPSELSHSLVDGRRREDCVNSVAVHPFCSLLFVASGQRHFSNSALHANSEASSIRHNEQISNPKISNRQDDEDLRSVKGLTKAENEFHGGNVWIDSSEKFDSPGLKRNRAAADDHGDTVDEDNSAAFDGISSSPPSSIQIWRVGCCQRSLEI